MTFNLVKPSCCFASLVEIKFDLKKKGSLSFHFHVNKFFQLTRGKEKKLGFRYNVTQDNTSSFAFPHGSTLALFKVLRPSVEGLTTTLFAFTT